jgi:hypothetical protein
MDRRGPVTCSEDQRQQSDHHQQPDQTDDADHAATRKAINAAAKRVMPANRELKRLEAVGATGKSA